MIYVNSSVALAYLFSEVRVPPSPMWDSPLVASRLLEYEMWTRLHARSGISELHFERARSLVTRMILIELTGETLARALEPFPVSLRTLDALHIATIEFLRRDGTSIELASYDARLIAAAKAMGIRLAEL